LSAEQEPNKRIAQAIKTVRELARYEKQLFESEFPPLDVRLDVTEQQEKNLRRQRRILNAQIDFLKNLLESSVAGLSQADREDGDLGRALEGLHAQRERIDRLRWQMAHAPRRLETPVATQGHSHDTGPHPLDGRLDIVNRRTIIRQNPEIGAKGICEIFDNSDVPLPRTMSETGSWQKALRTPQYRAKVETIISKDRKRAR
jgi:hypothetical protein